MKANEKLLLKFYCETYDYKCYKNIDGIKIFNSKIIKAKNGLMKANKKYACKFKIFKILI
jgi:hypothetical protein